MRLGMELRRTTHRLSRTSECATKFTMGWVPEEPRTRSGPLPEMGADAATTYLLNPPRVRPTKAPLGTFPDRNGSPWPAGPGSDTACESVQPFSQI